MAMLNYGNGTLDTQFGCGLFQKDTHGHMDEILPGGLNLGLTTRSEYTGRSRIAELISPIHVDTFFQEKLINGVDLRMRFIRAKLFLSDVRWCCGIPCIYSVCKCFH